MLRNFQSAFKSIVVDHFPVDTSTGTIRAAGALGSDSAAYEVYRRAYFARLTEALGEKYEAVWSVLGDARFFALCKRYISQAPSKSYSLSHYGEDFPDFLCTQNETSDFPFLPDLARFEQAFYALFHMRQHASLPLEDFVRVANNPKSQLVFTHTLKVFESSFSVYEIWKNRKTQASDRPGHYNLCERLMMYKSENRIFVYPLSISELDLFSALREGLRLEEIGTLAEGKMDPEQISRFFQFLATSGIVMAAKTPPSL